MANLLTYACAAGLDHAGLDSFAALNVMGYLKNMALLEQKIIIATIHQPRSAIWSMFDTVRP
jgi:ABC-type multidrug transport system ATPase subunit